MSDQRRVFTREFKQVAAQRMLDGESVGALHKELHVKRSVLYRWRDTYRQLGAAAFPGRGGRPPDSEAPQPPRLSPEEAAKVRIAELERKVGQQAMDIDFLQRAFTRVKESRQMSTEPGAKASMERSKT